MTAPIKPSVDDDGVPWCDDECAWCPQTNARRHPAQHGDVCLPAVLDLAAEVAAWRAWDNGSRRHNRRLSYAVKRTDAWRAK